MNILVFGQSFLGKIGGVQQSYAWLYEYLCRRGHSITHVTHLPVGEAGLYYRFPPQVEIRSLNILFDQDLPQKIRNLTREIDPDVVLVVNSGIRGFHFCSALRSTPYPVILSERGAPDYCIGELWKNRRLHELAVWCADFIHQLMPSYPASLPWELRRRARVISSLTMPATRFADPAKPAADGKYRIIFTGRFSPEKRVTLLVEAFGQLAPLFPDWQLRLTGAGPELDAIHKMINALSLAGRVELPGFVESPDALARHYAESHIYCLPSSFEGCPLALRDAMAHNLPVVGFASCPGTNEIILPGHNGLLAAEDSPVSLAKALAQLMASNELRARLAKNGQEDVKKYDPEKVHAAWESLLEEGANWKGRKKLLRTLRFLRTPFKSLFTALQTWICEFTSLKHETVTTSIFNWFSTARGNKMDMALLDFFDSHFHYPANHEFTLAYKSRRLPMLDKPVGTSSLSHRAVARNLAIIAARHGISLSNLYGPNERVEETDESQKNND